MDDHESAAPRPKKARSGRHVFLQQKEALVTFLEGHPALARPSSELGGTFSAHQRQSLWQELAVTLNSVGPATKDAAGWRRFWNDLVGQFKRDAGVVSRATTDTGCGKLLGLGGKVLSLIGRDCVAGCGPSFFLEDPTMTSDCVVASPVDPLTTLVEDQRALIEEVRGLRAEQHAQTQELQALRCAIEKACISVTERYDA
ncbi:hypothetical protein HPB52_023704 [Rhipicephalus sanguineus]|uniref:Regulatory protein zeste n=1 Tax=Rhipicephalus sanguineus TaxID=34632 RepID=A0A9D4YQY6_RHISA|nr:hypothetical protein HPB52_023704 [Rhipicephalus sanguineus]